MSHITQVFSTPVYHKQYNDQQLLNDMLISTVRKMAAEGKSHDSKRAHRGGYYSDGTFFNMNVPGMTEVQQLFKQALSEYFKELDVERTIKTVHMQGWVALTRGGDYQTPHVHAGSNISGVYYASMPDVAEPDGCIDFITPVDVQEMTFLKGLSRSYCRIQPRSGTVTLFPSYLRHYTHPFDTQQERICIVMNAFVSQG